MAKKLILIFLFVGSTLGGYLPILWGESAFSFASILCSGIGGFTGIYCGYMLSQTID
ncbi:MAG: hypothetical protein KA731_00875 [Candidatus Moranbacteria bacterium]|nr:hypothetical protein [Candidatus Moranbacteria bacterium]MBP6033973.1 hypothetical protein [Candidatus Moranbacteria bacterium]MBP7695568.1 hypothetical protein [Candidatus Moranbacteria bacterium]